jgi:hypothetical protein
MVKKAPYDFLQSPSFFRKTVAVWRRVYWIGTAQWLHG